MRPAADSSRPPDPARRGAVTVEFALVAPLVFLLVFAAIEFARLNMLVNSMENAAYEAARSGIIPGATTAQCEATALAILRAVGAVRATVAVTPTSISNSTTTVTVTISLPLNDNSWVTPQFTRNAQLVRSCTLRRELTY